MKRRKFLKSTCGLWLPSLFITRKALSQVTFEIAPEPRQFSSSGYNPATDPNVIEWLKADALALTDGAAVSTWTASTGKNAITFGTNPTFKTAIQNSLPVVRFNGTTNALQTAAFTSTQAQPFTIYCAFKLSAIASTQYVFDGRDVTNRALLQGNSSNHFIMSAGTNIDLGAYTAVWKIVGLQFNGASSSYSINGAAFSAGAAGGSNSIAGLTIGSNYSGSIFGSVDIGELFIVNGIPASPLTPITYLNSKWAVF